jgi:HAE1 family hydrophobic/amphiphilic exporter-1
MGGGISAPFIRHPIATSLLMIGVLFVGLVAYPRLPVAPLPQVDFPTIQVSVSLPGASPETMASAVAQPLETQFAQIPGVAQMTSTSVIGSSSITIQFDLERNIDAAANDVQSAINAAGGQLPKNLPNPPTYRKINPADAPILLLGVRSDTLPLTEVDDNIETKLAQQVSQISGVGQVFIGGQQKPAIRIQLDPAKLVAKGLSLEDVRLPLSITTVDDPKGTINGSTRSFTIYTNDQLTQSKDWNDVIVAYRNGAPLRVRDIGQAVTGPQDTTQAGWADGKRGMVLVIFKQPGANVIDTVDHIMAQIPRLRATMPPAIKIFTLSDRTQTIRAAVKDVQFTLLITVALVVMVIFIFLRSLWATVIPSITVPLALLGACALMWFAGYSLDNLSLMALTIAVGFVVDDAIVMLENITRYVEEGEEPFAAALKGSREIAFTIVSISVSLIAVLIPLLMMGGIMGRLFREFSVTLSMTIAVSALVSLTLTPMMASRFLKPPKEAHHGKLYAWSERAFDALLRSYERGLDRVLRHRFVTLCVFFATLGLSVYLFTVIPKGFFPQQDIGLITGIAEGAQDISPLDMQRHLEALGEVVLKDPDVAHLAMFVGGSGNPTNNGRLFITLKPRDERKANADQIIARLRPQIDKIEGAKLFLQAAQDVRVGGRPSRTQYQYTLQGADVAQLDEWAPKMLQKLKTLPELRDVATDQQTESTTLTLTIDRDQASRYGFTPQLIDDTLYDAFGQRQISTLFTQLNQYRVVLEVAPAFQEGPSALDDIYLRSTSNGEVPLSAVTRFDQSTTPLAVDHQGQFPVVTVSFNLAPTASLGDAVRAIGKVKNELGLPASIQAEFQGTAKAFETSLVGQPLLILAAVVTVYIVLGVLYESYIHPATILSTLPSAAVGALLALMICHEEFGIIALIGIILLIGIVEKNAIMMIDFALDAERKEGRTAWDAIFQASLLRFRPIVMTTMAALLAGVPLALGTGPGSELRRPLGIAIVGGLIFSQLLTLYTTPVTYLMFDRIAKRFRGRFAAQAIGQVAGGAS